MQKIGKLKLNSVVVGKYIFEKVLIIINTIPNKKIFLILKRVF